MFKVKDKVQPEIVYTVYAVDYLDRQGTCFLIYDESVSQWKWVTADYYEPISVALERRMKENG